MSQAVVHVVSYLEVVSASAREAAALLRRYRDSRRAAEGNRRLDVLQQRDRPDHFAILELWTDEPALEAHTRAAPTGQLAEQLRGLLVSPCDERLHRRLWLGSTPTSEAVGATYVLTHADAVPPAKDDAIDGLKELAEASRNDDGNLRYEVLQQRSRPNHFTIVEVWRSEPAREAHVMAAHTRRFRERFQPMTGSLYDERLYDAVD